MHPILTFLTLIVVFGAMFGGVLYSLAQISFSKEMKAVKARQSARENAAREMYAMRIRDTEPCVMEIPSLIQPTANYRKAI